jgi:hypothetical protein
MQERKIYCHVNNGLLVRIKRVKKKQRRRKKKKMKRKRKIITTALKNVEASRARQMISTKV